MQYKLVMFMSKVCCCLPYGLLMAAAMALGLFLTPSVPALAEEAPVLEEAADQLVNVVDITVRQPEIGESYNYNYSCSFIFIFNFL